MLITLVAPRMWRYCLWVTTDVRRVVALAVAYEILRAGRTTEWLSERIGMPAHQLRKKLAMQLDFTVADLGEIADALDVTPSQLMPCVHDV